MRSPLLSQTLAKRKWQKLAAGRQETKYSCEQDICFKTCRLSALEVEFKSTEAVVTNSLITGVTALKTAVLL